jgi:hypothetical protein
MTRDDRQWELLQSRWAAGESLSGAEDTERMKLASHQLERMREVELLRQLRQYLEGAPGANHKASLEPDFVDAVICRLQGRRAPHLRLVTDEQGQNRTEPEATTRVRRRPDWRHAMVLATCAAGAAFFLQQYSRDPEPVPAQSRAPKSEVALREAAVARSEVVFVSGDVTVDGAAIQLGRGTLSGGESIMTGVGQACLTVEPRIDVCLGSNSRAVLESLREHDVRVKVLEGRVVAALAPRKRGSRFALTDGEVSAVARGTIFALTKDAEAARTQVTVLEGKVEVSGGSGESTLVHAHSEIEIGRSRAPKRVAISRTHEAQFLALVAPRELWERGELGVLSIGDRSQAHERSHEGSWVMIGREGPFGLPVSTFAPAGQHRVVLRDARGAESLVDVEVRVGATEKVDASAEPTAAAAAGPRQDTPSADALLDEARRALQHGDSAGALAAYRRLRALHPNSAEAATVLVTVGKLELRQNAPARALNAFNAYLKRGGPLQPEALAGKIRALRALGNTVEEQRSIERYLASYPDGFEAVALEKRLEVLSGR